MNSKLIAFFFILCAIVTASYGNESSIRINKLILNGLKTNSTEEVLSFLTVKEKQIFEPEQIPLLKQELAQYFQAKGFYLAIIDQPEIIPISPTLVDLVFQINEGSPAEISKLSFTGNRYFSDLKLKSMLGLQSDKVLSFKQLPDVSTRILAIYTNRGYLFCQVRIDSLIALDSGFTALVKITEGPLFKPENYLFSGNKVTRPNTIVNISGVNQVKQISPSTLLQAENNLLRKPYIKSCNIIPIDATTLLFKVEESKMTRLEGVLGVATNIVTNKQELNGYINVQFMNLWGTDRALNLTWRSLQTRYQLLKLAYHEAGWLRYPIAGDITFQREKQDSLWIKLRAGSDIYYRFINARLGIELNTESLYPVSTTDTTILQTDYKYISTFWDFSKLDYPSNPRTGYAFLIKYGWVRSVTEAEAKTVPNMELDLSYYMPLSQNWVIAMSAHGRQISDQQAKVYEQYKMGGFRSLRGYNEDEFSSWRLGWVNSELRYLLTIDSRLFVLLDSGVLQVPDSVVKTDLFALGGGISFSTKVGVFSLSYALRYTDKRLSGIGSGMIHIGLDSSL